MQARHIKIIQLLLNNQSEFISATEIANYVNVSNRTARNDIKLIKLTMLRHILSQVIKVVASN